MQIELLNNTIKFTIKFYGFDNKHRLVDPDSVEFTLYDNNFSQIQNVILGEENKKEEGVYEYYFVPDTPGHYIVEFKGVFGEMPSLERKHLQIEMI